MAVKKRPRTLSHGRPPVAKAPEHMSSKRSAAIIRTHHRLQKEHAAAIRKGDAAVVASLEKAIEQNGGLKVYQAASKQGQSKDRGGDSSKLLVDWLQQAEVLPRDKNEQDSSRPLYRLLEVGALSTKNEISKFPKVVEVTRIDLNSQEPGIKQQDFMEMPLPMLPEERFDIISLSLVLNYVPDAVGRGEMLKRITQFLRPEVSNGGLSREVLPALFLVLPLPCVANSRYMSEQLLQQIMTNLGFEMTNTKKTNKLCYYLFRLSGKTNGKKQDKKKVRDSVAMNNFSIVIR